MHIIHDLRALTSNWSFLVIQNFTKSPIDQNILYGYNTSFECTSVGIPNPVVSWVKVDAEDKFMRIFNNRTNRILITPNKMLHINDVRYGDEGQYVCFSESPRLKVNVSAILHVYGNQILVFYF